MTKKVSTKETKKSKNPKGNLNALGFEIPEVLTDEEFKTKSISPFDFINAISYTKENLIVDEETEKLYNSWIINKGLSYSLDTIIWANEMNCNHSLPSKMQFEFLKGNIRAKKRFNKWLKADVIDDLSVIQEYYKCSINKAKEALNILTEEQLEIIKKKLDKGGIKKK